MTDISSADAARPEWLDWPSNKITRNLNEYADKLDTTLAPALAEAQTTPKAGGALKYATGLSPTLTQLWPSHRPEHVWSAANCRYEYQTPAYCWILIL